IYYPPFFNGYGYDQAASNGGNYQANVNVTQQLIMKKAKQAQYENLNILNQYIGNASKISELDLKKAVTGQYITAYSDFNMLQSAQEMLLLLNDEEEMLKPLVQRGIYMQNDFLNVRMAKETQLLAIRQARIQYQNDLYALNIICGLDDTTFASLGKPDIAPSAMFDAENSVLLKQYRLDSLKFMNRKKLVDVNYVPKLAAIADAGLWATNPVTAYKNFGAGIGLNFSMPLYDGKQRKMEYQKLVLAAQVSHNYETFYRKQFQQQVLQLKAQLSATDELLAETSKQIDLAQELIRNYRLQLNSGLVKITDLVLTINNYINFKTSLNQTTMTRLQIINQLNYYK
ncbi:MAG: Outer rane efflux protein, partial [Bacteroidota bacterium]|nr:Outer rane efflux protein [Bacteroidota bacterium]